MDIFAGRSALDEGSILETSNARIWVHDTGGAGEPLFLVGGFTAGHFAFDFARPYLRDYRLLTWEPRGLGRSESRDGRYEANSAAVWAEDLHEIFEQLGLERAYLWAGGFGSYITFAFAARHPEAVGALATYTDVWHGDEVKGYGRIWNVYKAIVENFGTTGFGARVLANIFDISNLPWFAQWEARNIEEVLHRETVEHTVGYGLTQADVRDDLGGVQAPTLVVQGALGWDGSPVEESEDPSLALIRERIPKVEVVTIPDAHPGYVLVQQPEAVSTAVARFFERHPLR
jgi:pimeloyl-ACP methyl ester carboxylesterase